MKVLVLPAFSCGASPVQLHSRAIRTGEDTLTVEQTSCEAHSSTQQDKAGGSILGRGQRGKDVGLGG